MIRRIARFIVKCMDILTCIPHNIMISESWDPETASALAYGLSLMFGFVCSAFAAVFALGSILVLIGLVITYPVRAASIVLFIGIFLLAGYLRHRLGGKQ